MKTHFDLFGLEPAYALEAAALDRAYREIQAQIHPDRFAHSGEAERRASMQWPTRVNEAYRTLKDPVGRARYLLELNGVDVAFETHTAMPAEFLVRQMEQREALEMAAAEKDAGALERLRAALRLEKRELQAALGERIDANRDYAGAAGIVRKLMFLDKLDAEIDAAYAEMEG
ncbi:MAG: Fe-S protein assembly co-chaperone HscB [Burkholderiales bacterium]